MIEAGADEQDRAPHKDQLLVREHQRLIAVGFEKGRPAPPHLAMQVGRDVVAAGTIVAYRREMRRKVRACVLETAKLKVIIDSGELRERIRDEIFVAQLAKPLRCYRRAGLSEITVELVECREHVVLDRRRAVGEGLGPRRLATLHLEQALPCANARGEYLGRV